MITEQGHRYLVARKVAKTIRNSVFALLKDIIAQWGLSSHFTINKSEFRITCNLNGNEIICVGLDDPEKIKSITGITGMWLEEASEFELTDFNQLDLRLRGHTHNYKQIIITFNPISETHWLKKEFFDQRRDDASVLKTTYHDNRFIDDNYKQVLENLKHSDYTYYMVYCMGNWGSLGHMVYTNYEVHDFSLELEDYSSVYWGVDWGYNDPTAYVQVGIKDDEVYIMREFYQSGLSNRELIAELSKFHNPRHMITADSSEPARIKEFKASGFQIQPAKKGQGSIKAGIDFLRARKIHIHPDCINFRKEISMYKYRQDAKGNVLDEPVDFMNHILDATRYATESLAKHRKKLKALKTLG